MFYKSITLLSPPRPPFPSYPVFVKSVEAQTILIFWTNASNASGVVKSTVMVLGVLSIKSLSVCLKLPQYR